MKNLIFFGEKKDICTKFNFMQASMVGTVGKTTKSPVRSPALPRFELIYATFFLPKLT